MTYPVLSLSQQNVSRIHCRYQVLYRPADGADFLLLVVGKVRPVVQSGFSWNEDESDDRLLRKWYELQSSIKTNVFC